VGDDVTGKTIATVDPPRGMQFTQVEGTSDDRTFIALTSAQPSTAAQFIQTLYLLRIAMGTQHPYELTRLPIKLPGSGDVLRYALSPDGRELAVESSQDTGHFGTLKPSPDGRGLAVESSPSAGRSGTLTTLGIYAVPSGAQLRAWSTRTSIASDLSRTTLSWLADGRQLAFSDVPLWADLPTSQHQLRTIDVTGAGTDLLGDSRVLLTVKIPTSSPSDCWTMHLTPDGGTVICGTQYGTSGGLGTSAGCANGGLEFTAYSAVAGKPVRDLYQYRVACSNGNTSLLWTDASAKYIIGATQINMTSNDGDGISQLGVITDGRIRLLKLPKSVPTINYGLVAF
jgi:hypothetical protein